MRSFRSKPVGWRGESYRHSLAARGYHAKKLKGFEQAQLRRIRGERKDDEFDELLKRKEVKKDLTTSTGEKITQYKTELPEDVLLILSKTARVKRVKPKKVVGKTDEGEEEFDPEKFIEEQLNIRQEEQPDFIRKSDAIKMMIEKRVEAQKQKKREEREYEEKEREKQLKERERKQKAEQQLEEFMQQFEDKEV